jgi:hypothetical protein
MVAAQTNARVVIPTRRPVLRPCERRGRIVRPAKAPPCRIVLKLPPPAQAHPGREFSSLRQKTPFSGRPFGVMQPAELDF